MFLEKTKLKDVSSNDVELFRDLRIILIAAQRIMSLMHCLVTDLLQEQMQTIWMFGKLGMMAT